jgi:hypothetical protein
MKNIKFDLETSYISNSVDISDDKLKDLGVKLANQGIKFTQEDTTPGAVAQWMAENLSPNELLFMATREYLSGINEATTEVNKACSEHSKAVVNKSSSADIPSKKALKKGKKLLKQLQAVKTARDFAKILAKIANGDGITFKDGRVRIGAESSDGETRINPENMPTFGSGVPEGLVEFLTKIKNGLVAKREAKEAEEAAANQAVCPDPAEAEMEAAKELVAE